MSAAKVKLLLVQSFYRQAAEERVPSAVDRTRKMKRRKMRMKMDQEKTN